MAVVPTDAVPETVTGPGGNRTPSGGLSIDTEMAVPLLERATKLNPEKSDPYYLLYRSYRALKQPEKATAALEQFKRLKALGS